MRIRAAISGDLKKIMRAEERLAARAISAGVKTEGDRLKKTLRGQVFSAGLGRRLANSWRANFYRNEGLDAADLVYSKAPKLHGAFDKGVTIRSKNGFYLAIPTPAAPKRGTGGKRISPSNFPEYRFGKLRFVYRRSGASLLVVDGVRISARTGRVGKQAKGGMYTKTGRIKSGITTVVMFWLVPRTRLKKRLHVDRAGKAARQRLPETILREFNRFDGNAT